MRTTQSETRVHFNTLYPGNKPEHIFDIFVYIISNLDHLSYRAALKIF